MEAGLNNTLKKTLDSISKGNNIDLDTLRSNISQTINKMEPVSEKLNTPASKVVNSVNSMFNYFKIFLIVLITIVLGINLYTFVMYKQDALTYFFEDFFNFEEKIHVSEEKDEDLEKNKELNTDEDGTVYSKLDVAAEKEAHNVKNNPDNLDKAIDQKKQDNYDEDLEKKNYKANNLSVNVNKKSGFCYLGTDRGVRTCVEVDDEDTCLSNEIYPSQSLCINPNLKE